MGPRPYLYGGRSHTDWHIQEQLVLHSLHNRTFYLQPSAGIFWCGPPKTMHRGLLYSWAGARTTHTPDICWSAAFAFMTTLFLSSMLRVLCGVQLSTSSRPPEHAERLSTLLRSPGSSFSRCLQLPLLACQLHVL